MYRTCKQTRNRRPGIYLRPSLRCLEDRAVPATITVTNNNDLVTIGDGVSLREAILSANQNLSINSDVVAQGSYGDDGVEFVFQPGFAVTIGSELLIEDSVAIIGSTFGVTISGGDAVRVLHVKTGADTVSMTNLTITKGAATGNGGGVLLENGELTLNNCQIGVSPASGRNTSTGDGGGIYAQAGSLTMNDCNVLSNAAAGSGGGIYSQAAAVVVNRGSIQGNAANGTGTSVGGGGIFAQTAALAVADCSVSANTSTDDGAGIYSKSAPVTVTGSFINANIASEDGGGIRMETAALKATDSKINGNVAGTAGKRGGGIFSEGPTTLTACDFDANNAEYGAGVSLAGASAWLLMDGETTVHKNVGGFLGDATGAGIRLHNVSTTTASVIRDSEIYDNHRVSGGGGIAVIGSGTVKVIACTIRANGTVVDEPADVLAGGGLYVERDTKTNVSASIEVSGTTFVGNSADQNGGAVAIKDIFTDIVIYNTTISGNGVLSLTAGLGGGISWLNDSKLNSTAVVTVANCTVYNNKAFKGGGAGLLTASDKFVLDSTIVAKNNLLSGGAGTDIFNSNAQITLSVPANACLIGIEDDGGFQLKALVAAQTGTAASPLDPLLRDLGFNGGRTQTHAPIYSATPSQLSKAIDNGRNDLLSLATDQRGAGYKREVELLTSTGTPQADIGAYEVQSIYPTVVNVVMTEDKQRSMVTSITISFSEAVTFSNGPDAAFLLVRDTAVGPEQFGQTGAVNILATPVLPPNAPPGASGVVALTFQTSGSNPIFGVGNPAKASLPDGLYKLTVFSAEVNGALGQLDGNADGTPGDDFVLVGTAANKFFRLFGDADGDGDVDATDFGAMRAAFGTDSLIFDYDGDGDVDAADFGMFRAHFGLSV